MTIRTRQDARRVRDICMIRLRTMGFLGTEIAAEFGITPQHAGYRISQAFAGTRKVRVRTS